MEALILLSLVVFLSGMLIAFSTTAIVIEREWRVVSK